MYGGSLCYLWLLMWGKLSNSFVSEQEYDARSVLVPKEIWAKLSGNISSIQVVKATMSSEYEYLNFSLLSLLRSALLCSLSEAVLGGKPPESTEDLPQLSQDHEGT